ncbi:hypothetical protein pb186bvf_011962 [Paramecium bursaria]
MQQLFWKKIEIENKKSGRPPKIEENVNLTYLIDKNKYIYTDGLAAFNIKDLVQEERSPSPPKTDGISFKIGTHKRVQSPFGQNQDLTDYVYLLEPENNTWSIHKTSGKPPSRRTNSYVWYDAPYLYVYGGVSQGKTMSDLYILNVDKFVWKRFFYLEGPPGRLHFGFATQGEKKYLVGGSSMPENLLMDDVWELSFENVAWDTQSLELPGITWTKLPFSNMPSVKGNSVIQVNESELISYGGFNKQKQVLDQCLLLDLVSFEVGQLEFKGQSPGPRAFHKILFVKDNLLCLYGGFNVNENQIKNSEPLNDFYLLDLQVCHWQRPVVGGYIPTPRQGFAFAGNQNEMHAEICLLGGRVADGSIEQCLYVLHELDMDQGEAWDIRNDEEKNKYETYREVIKENKSAKIPTLTLEYDEAEKIILEQKRQLGEKEKELKGFQSKCQELHNKAENIQNSLDERKQELDLKLEQMKIEIAENNQSSEQNQETIDKIMQLLVQERKRRKLVQRKIIFLQDAFRKTEHYILELDKTFLKGTNEQLLETTVNEDVLHSLEIKKQEHTKFIKEFRTNFEDHYKKEQQVRQQLKQSKIVLTKFENLNEAYKRSLIKEEKLYFDKK